MKSVCIIGHFGHGENLLNGQTVKTKIVTKEIVKELYNSSSLFTSTTGVSLIGIGV